MRNSVGRDVLKERQKKDIYIYVCVCVCAKFKKIKMLWYI
jgi:hypothetical protein